jgi:hypothetical protein
MVLIVWYQPQANASMAAAIAQSKKFTTVQRLAMKATLGCYRTTPTMAMEVESGLEPAWIRLQTKVLTAATRMQSLAPNHPVWTWLKLAAENARSIKPNPHCSNLESLTREFSGLMACTIERVYPFTNAPWDAVPQRGGNDKGKMTKASQQQQIKKLAKATWEKYWSTENLTTATHLRRIYGKMDTKVGPDLYKEVGGGRATGALLAQFRTGHCGLNYYLSRFKIVESAACEKCGYEKETVEHFLMECPSFWRERQALRTMVGTGRLKMTVLLGDKEGIKATMQYISATGRFKKEVE